MGAGSAAIVCQDIQKRVYSDSVACSSKEQAIVDSAIHIVRTAEQAAGKSDVVRYRGGRVAVDNAPFDQTKGSGGVHENGTTVGGGIVQGIGVCTGEKGANNVNCATRGTSAVGAVTGVFALHVAAVRNKSRPSA